ncbi:MAG TPA: COX15/CtaA family protein [candidate division Zixibacteria bacterium]|nr:COX15/CtaA family protein [candidate division Zixibacteria bacterium]
MTYTTSVAQGVTTPFNRAHHRFAMVVAGCVFCLIIAGALVTSNDAGLSVPDWPTSFGSMYKIPPLVNGVQFEHIHRMIAQFIGLLTIILALWTQRVDRRPWMKALGWAALGTVIAQGLLGGLTVMFKLPPAISTAHATLAQTFFCIIVSMALFTSQSWVEETPVRVADEGRLPLTTISILTVIAIWLQLILGAAFRHSGMKLLPHLIGAVVVVAIVHVDAIRAIKRFREIPQVKKPATALLMLIGLQVVLGIGAYITRVVLSPGAPKPLESMVATTVAHVAGGALVLATAVALAIQIHRHTLPSGETAVTPEGRPVHA